MGYEIDLDTIDDVVRQLLEITPVGFRQDEVADLHAPGSDHLLLDAASGKHLAGK